MDLNMHTPAKKLDSQTQSSLDPCWVVNEYLRFVMIPDPIAALRFVAPEMRILFTGGRLMHQPAECAAFNASRYAWVKKRIEKTELVQASSSTEFVVYSLGTLYGAWPDGTLFEGNRYVDRYVVRDGLITQLEVWNDSAEWLLVRAGLATLDVAPDAA
uniref:nuclear transport factor 2 family protein n=1 Tax=Polaromonas sp. E10S TaxID=1840239 RepID=UPI00351B5025